MMSFCVCTEDGAVANLTSIHADATVTCMTQNKHSLRAQPSVCSSHAVNGQSKARLVTVHIQCHLSHSRIHCCLTYFFKMYFSSIIHPTVLPTYSSHYFHYTMFQLIFNYEDNMHRGKDRIYIARSLMIIHLDFIMELTTFPRLFYSSAEIEWEIA